MLAPFITRGIVSQDVMDQVLSEGVQQIVAIILAGFLFGWSFWRKIIAQLKIKIASKLPEDTSNAVISAEVDAMPTSEKIAVAFAPDKEGVK